MRVLSGALLVLAACGEEGRPTVGAFDGTWQGRTSQGRAVSLVILDGRVAILEIGYRVAGGASCTTGDDVTLIPESPTNRVHDRGFAFDASVEGITDRDGSVLEVEATFADDRHLNGRLAIRRDEPCSDESYLWSARRS